MIHVTYSRDGWKKLSRRVLKKLRDATGRVKCAACGAENKAGYLYCYNCGRPLSK